MPWPLGHAGSAAEGAFHDELTGLANRRLLQRRFAEARDQAWQTGEALAILVIDLNGLKAINERFDQAAGDEPLRRVATVLSASMRGSDGVARIRGDEFLVLAAIRDTGHVRAVAARVVDLIAAVPAPEGLHVRVGRRNARRGGRLLRRPHHRGRCGHVQRQAGRRPSMAAGPARVRLA